MGNCERKKKAEDEVTIRILEFLLSMKFIDYLNFKLYVTEGIIGNK
jgi:hypothetical protein